MNAPVTAALPAVRPAGPRASDTGLTHSAAPFASALDGALNENRANASDRGADRASDRGADRRSTPEERTSRADERSSVTDQRVDDRARAAEQRAEDKAARTDARAQRAAERAAQKAAEKDAHEVTDTDGTPAPVDGGTVPGEVAPETDDTSTEPAGKSTEAPRGGLPALWALIMGGSLATAPAGETPADPATTAPAPVPGVPAVEATGPAVPAVALAAPTDAAVAVPATGVPAPAASAPATEAVAAPVPSVGAPAVATPGAPTGETLPTGFSAVLAEAGAVVTATATGTGTGTGTTPAPTATTSPVLPADTVPDAPAATATPSAAPAVVPPAAPVATDGEAAPTAGTSVPGAADAVVAPIGGSTSGEAPSGDAGSAGQDTPDNAPPTPGTTGSSTVSPATSVVAAQAAADVDGATGAAATLPVGSQVARQVAVLGAGPDGDHSMTLVLTPETLGEVQVQVTLSKGSIELALRGAHEHGRAALLDALPELRRELEAAGLNPSRVEVARDTGGSWQDRQPAPQQGFGEQRGQHDRGENRSRPWGRPADIAGSGPSLNPNRSTSSGVDVRV